jgi:hypothetical protein
MELFNIIDRDFPKNERPFMPSDEKTLQMIDYIASQFMNFDDFNKSQYNNEGKPVYLIDTCSLIKKNTDSLSNGFYIITCGVFLEILQGATRKTIMDGTFQKDIHKLVMLKKTMKEDCAFIMLGRKRRAYWNGYEPSKSCRNCINCDQPHFKILRDIDTELYRLSIMMNCEIETCDHILQKRIIKHYSGVYTEDIVTKPIITNKKTQIGYKC